MPADLSLVALRRQWRRRALAAPERVGIGFYCCQGRLAGPCQVHQPTPEAIAAIWPALGLTVDELAGFIRTDGSYTRDPAELPPIG